LDKIDNKNYKLLLSIINNPSLFDKLDNTFKTSNRQIASKLNVSASKVDRLFRLLKSKDLVRDVRQGKGKLRMLSPKFIYTSRRNYDRWINGALWDLGCYEKVRQWRKVCRELNQWIDPDTGEMKSFNWYYIDVKADQVSCFDRCYRKGDKETYYIEEDRDSSQGYRINELKAGNVTDYDLRWFDMINRESDQDYPLLCKDNFRSHPVLSVYKIKL